jgi:hypothetical protein
MVHRTLTAETDSEPTHDQGQFCEQAEDGYGQSAPPARVEWPYKRIAADIVIQVLEEAGHLHAQSHAKVRRARNAIAWLFGPAGVRGRALWLAWLDLTEVGLWQLMAKGDRFGETNVLPAYLIEMARLQCIA